MDWAGGGLRRAQSGAPADRRENPEGPPSSGGYAAARSQSIRCPGGFDIGTSSRRAGLPPARQQTALATRARGDRARNGGVPYAGILAHSVTKRNRSYASDRLTSGGLE